MGTLTQGRPLYLLQKERPCSTGLPKVKAHKARAATTASTESKSNSAYLKRKISKPHEQATQAEGCIDLGCIAEFVRLNTSTLCKPDSLYINLTIPSVSLSLQTLLDSHCLHCFMDKQFIANHNIQTVMVRPIRLHLFDMELATPSSVKWQKSQYTS